MTTKILFRQTLAEENEFETAKKHFEVIDSRSLVKPGDKIICRYSALPYYEELEKDVLFMRFIRKHLEYLDTNFRAQNDT